MSENIDKFGLPSDEYLFEMANIRKSTSGLPVNIWVSTKTKNHNSVRIKVSNTYSNAVDPDLSFIMFWDGNDIIISGNTGELKYKDIESVRLFFKKHISIFQLLWEKQIDDDEFKRMIKKVSNG